MTLPIPSVNERIDNGNGIVTPVWRRFLAQIGQSTTTTTTPADPITLGTVIGLNGINVSGDLSSGLKIRFAGGMNSLAGVDLTDIADGDRLVWNEADATWRPGAGATSITVSDTAPSSPTNGQGWVDTTDGTFYIWYDDGTSAAWVAFGSAGGGGAASDITYDNATSGLTATDVQAAIDEVVAAKASLASPAFTGNPTAPTPTAGGNDTSIATTAFVTTAVAAGGGSSDARDFWLLG